MSTKLLKSLLFLLVVSFTVKAQTSSNWICTDINNQYKEIDYLKNKYSKDRFVAEAIRLSHVVNPDGEIKYKYVFKNVNPYREDILMECLDEYGKRTGINKWVLSNTSDGNVSQSKKVSAHYNIEINVYKGNIEYSINCTDFEEFVVVGGYWKSQGHLNPKNCFPLDKGSKKGGHGKYYTFATKEMVEKASLFQNYLNATIKKKYSDLLAQERKQKEEVLKKEEEEKRKRDYDEKLNQLINKYGKLTSSFGIGSMDIENEIHVFPNSKTLVLYGDPISFDLIIDAKLSDETTLIEGRTVTKSLGGEFWLFGMGIGSTEKTTHKEADKTLHHYYLDIKLDRWANNFITINLGGNKVIAEELNGVFEKIFRDRNTNRKRK